MSKESLLLVVHRHVDLCLITHDVTSERISQMPTRNQDNSEETYNIASWFQTGAVTSLPFESLDEMLV